MPGRFGWRGCGSGGPGCEGLGRGRVESGEVGQGRPRRYPLGQTLLIGRTSRSRGIQPDIDLTGPPEDAGVSHAHALLVADPDGGWSVVDLDSANGTYHNEGTDPITANVPVPVKDGDRIHVGAWTTLTLHAG